MQREFRIDLRVNYADMDKNETMQKSIAIAARHIYATAQLLSDGIPPEIAIHSDDWFSGKKEILLLQDVIQEGLDQTSDTADTPISDELMKAFTT